MKKISTLAVAALLAVSMSAFADNTNTKSTDGKSCDKMTAAECQKKDPNCTKTCAKANNSCSKHDMKSCTKSSDKKS